MVFPNCVTTEFPVPTLVIVAVFDVSVSDTVISPRCTLSTNSLPHSITVHSTVIVPEPEALRVAVIVVAFVSSM